MRIRLIWAVVAAAATALAGDPLARVDWSFDFGEGLLHPVAYPDAGHTAALLLTASSGRIRLLGPDGAVLASMRLDLPPSTNAIAVSFSKNDEASIVAADVAGSIYCFRRDGQLEWKYARDGKATDFRHLAVADLDGDGTPEVLLCDSRGHLFAVDSHGRLKLEVTTTTFRLGTPAAADLDGDGRMDLVFGTEDDEAYAIHGDGRLLWRASLPGAKLGRAVPVIADLTPGKPVVLLATPFVAPFQGVIALDGATGARLWTARSLLQSYESTLVADIDGDGFLEVLYGDKSTRLFCVDRRGKRRWAVQVDGKGIFFAPAALRIKEHGPAILFQVVRAAGVNGKSLYVIGSDGAVLDSLPLAGGGSSGPELCRFSGGPIAMLVSSGSHLTRFSLKQGPGAQILGTDQHLERPSQAPPPPDASSFGVMTARTVDADGAVRVTFRKPDEVPPDAPPAPRRHGSGPLDVQVVKNPWAQHALAVLRDGVVDPPVRVRMLGNEYESAAIAITNQTAKPSTIALRQSGLAPHALEFRSVPPVVSNTTGIPQEDPLPLLARDGTITLQPDETREIWLTFHSRDLTPGLHNAAIRLSMLERFSPPIEVPVEVTVSFVRLPDRFHYRHCNWLYLASIKDEQVLDSTIRDAVGHGTNVFNIPQPSVAVDCAGTIIGGDAAVDDRLIPKLPGAFFLVDGSVNLQWPAGCKPDRATEDRAYAAGLGWLARHMRELGIDYPDYAVYLQDEPGLMGRDAAFDRFVESVKRVKRADPKMQVYANPAGGAFPDVIAPLDGLVDIWCPDLHLYRLFPDKFDALFKKVKNYWHYEAPSDQRRLDPLGFYRVKPWIAYQLGMNGGGYWVYSQTDYFAPDPARGTEYGVVYPTPQGPVTSKRWEASRDGSEDYELLVMLRDAAMRAGGAEQRQALDLIAEAVAFATRGQEKATDIGRQLRTYAPDFSRWMEYRARLIDMAEKLGAGRVAR